MEQYILNEEGIEQVADAILSKLSYSRIILLEGDLGSGKTTLAKCLIRKLGVTATITSPTFNLVSEYQSETSGTIYHLDLYRLKDTNELYEIGFSELLDSGAVCIIEWPEIASPLLEASCISVQIAHADGKRIYSVEEL